ncbi:hypothetical protein [Skermania piniformis]|uniref:DUF8021 domain-containing protein n=1 Tax=Skermania pinensis TaxID=39122 RepID=A0ABX8SCK5_9ACTN|nr:hypothetical protein [Skermania piniformis]QXQ14175.1 hypothetical protein KV203_01645 [Skermania piniformis]
MTGQLEVARGYLDALVSHDGAGVAFAPGAVRYEMGIKTGRSGAHLRRSLSRGPQYRVIRRIYDLAATVDGDLVRTTYRLDAGLFGRRLATVRVDEDFLIPAAVPVIHRIDAWIRLPRGAHPTSE